MIFIGGTERMGKVDVVPGLMHVETLFGHLYYFPLIPLESVLVLGEPGTLFREVRIGFSIKSILLAWLRGLTLLGAIIALIWAVVAGLWADGQADWTTPAVWTVTLATACLVLFKWKLLTRASFSRACQLVARAQLSDAGYAVLEKHFGQASPRGFGVIPSDSSRRV